MQPLLRLFSGGKRCPQFKYLLQTNFLHKSSRFDRLMASSSVMRSNRLSHEKSPYLLQHANNPVDWYPWGPDAFQKAKDESKPIFLSVGYSTCHWCHVMERESFENPDIGRLLNENFINIKVDREERPDVDKVYMTFVQATTGSGGWPMSVWLTPDLKPIFGGTYFPPDDRYHNRPGFASIITVVAQMWKEKRGEIENQGTKILDALMKGIHSGSQSSDIPSLSICEKCFESLEKSFDSDQGGFGKSPKFPQPVNINFLLRYFSGKPDSENGVQALQMSLLTLQKMALGGMHDHISQGFHRYSTDQNWHVPHFEKMLYDQGQLAVSYADAYQITKDPIHVDIARDIFTYVNRDLSHPSGGFFSAEDADSLPSESSSEKKEGAFCVWRFEDVQNLLSQKLEENPNISFADVFCRYYGIVKEGNVDPLQDPHDELKNQNVLIIREDIEKVASEFNISTEELNTCVEKCREALFKERQLRPKPHLDDKMIAAWNGLMISGFARGGQVLNDDTLKARAIRGAEFLKQHMFLSESGYLLRSCYTLDKNDVTHLSNPIQGFVDDYAFVIRGLLDLYETCYDESWLIWAEQLQATQNRLFWDEEGGGYFSSPGGDSSIVLRIKEDQDGAEPSPNSVSAMNLLRFSSILDLPDWRNKAEIIFKTFSQRLEKVPFAVPELVSSLMFHHSGVKQIIIIGDKDCDDTKLLLGVVNSHFLPNKILMVTDGTPESFLAQRIPIVKSLTKIDGKATAYVCENFACSLPVNSSDELEKQLTKGTVDNF